jgi:hypothetical protein
MGNPEFFTAKAYSVFPLWSDKSVKGAIQKAI